MTKRSLSTTFRTIAEDQPGPKLQAVFHEYWPAYRRWFARDGLDFRPSLERSLAALHEHMPEIAPLHQEIMHCVGGDEVASRFLSLFSPPPIIRGCSQAVWNRDGQNALIRNYDHAPHLCDALILRTAWLGKRVIASADCIWGALDGVNEDGLCVALAFGGRQTVEEGFGASLVVRYLLQVCATVQEAARVLRRLPVHMAYTFALLDAVGEHRTVHVSPDRKAIVTKSAVSTNHQGKIEWPEYATFCHTVERADCLAALLEDEDLTLEDLITQFRKPPLHRKDHARGSGTLYTVALSPKGKARYLWPSKHFECSFDHFEEEHLPITYHQGVGAIRSHSAG